MDIKYIINEQKTRIVAIPVVKGKYAEGIDEKIADALIAMGHVGKKNLTIDYKGIVGIAKVHPDDTYSEQEGKDLAKERLLIKYNKELARVHRRYSEELGKLQAISKSRYNSSLEKITRATKRKEKMEEKLK